MAFDIQTIDDAVDMVHDLMEGDPETFKAGYTFDNAVFAVADVSKFDHISITKQYIKREDAMYGNEDGSNRDVPPFDNDPRTDEEIKQAIYDRDPDDEDHPGWNEE